MPALIPVSKARRFAAVGAGLPARSAPIAPGGRRRPETHGSRRASGSRLGVQGRPIRQEARSA